jgi:hypothetical protein
VQTTLVRLEIKADNIKFIKNIASGIINSIQVDQFDSLSDYGSLIVNVTNTDSIVGTFIVQIVNCNNGIIIQPATASASIGAFSSLNFNFSVFTTEVGGQINNCTAQLVNPSADVMWN